MATMQLPAVTDEPNDTVTGVVSPLDTVDTVRTWATAIAMRFRR
jgi:hypothetical protein